MQLLLLKGLPAIVAKRLGGSYTRVGEPEQKEPGRPEDLPRTAAMNRVTDKKSPPSDGRRAPYAFQVAKPSAEHSAEVSLETGVVRRNRKAVVFL